MKLKKSKKGSELSLETIIIFIILLIAFMVVITFFVVKYHENSLSITDLGESNIEGIKTLVYLAFKI